MGLIIMLYCQYEIIDCDVDGRGSCGETARDRTTSHKFIQDYTEVLSILFMSHRILLNLSKIQCGFNVRR